MVKNSTYDNYKWVTELSIPKTQLNKYNKFEDDDAKINDLYSYIKTMQDKLEKKEDELNKKNYENIKLNDKLQNKTSNIKVGKLFLTKMLNNDKINNNNNINNKSASNQNNTLKNNATSYMGGNNNGDMEKYKNLLDQLNDYDEREKKFQSEISKLKSQLIEQEKLVSGVKDINNIPFNMDSKYDDIEDKKIIDALNSENRSKKKEENKDKDKERQRPQRRVRIKLDNLADRTPELSKNTFTFGKNANTSSKSTAIEETKDDDDDIFDIQEEQYVQYEGYVYKYSQTQKKMKKTYFKLIGKDLYYYKKKEEKNHRGMHNLSGVFIKKGEDFEYEGKKYLSIVILYKSEKSYYFDNEEDFNIWFQKLNAAIQNKSLFDKYEVKQKIGKGKFGLVKCGINKETKMPVAIKIMAKKNMDKSDLELAKVEIDILKIGQHPNIIKLYDIYENENYIYIIMEYCSGGDLLSYFEYHEYELPESKVCEIIHKLSMAIYYLHSYGIVHRDLKPENILMTDISDTADIRLLDFGLSKIVGNEEKCTEPYGTLSFVAPEVLQGKPYDKSVDLWSIGIITFLLLCGYLPFDDKHSEREIARQTIQDPVPYEKKIWDKYSPEAKAFVDGLLQKKPEKRYTIKEVLEHPWIKKMDKVPEKRKDTKNKSQFGFYTSKEE
jgi:hypothetical protein